MRIDFTGITRTLKLMDQMELNNITVIYEVVEPYKYGTKRQTFNFNDWIELITKNR